MKNVTAKMGDRIRVSITPGIEIAAGTLLAEVLAEMHTVWPDATLADQRRVAINVLLEYFGQQNEPGAPYQATAVTYPLPAPEPPDAG